MSITMEKKLKIGLIFVAVLVLAIGSRVIFLTENDSNDNQLTGNSVAEDINQTDEKDILKDTNMLSLSRIPNLFWE